MAFPKLLQKLFANSGAGPKLRSDIIPTDEALDATSTNPIANSAVKAALNSKADTTLSNLSATGKETAAHLGMPSRSSVDLTPPTINGQLFTAPADGYFVGDVKFNSGSGYLLFYIQDNTSPVQYYLNCAGGPASGSANYDYCVTVAVSKGQVLSTWFVASLVSTWEAFKFVYANGSQS